MLRAPPHPCHPRFGIDLWSVKNSAQQTSRAQSLSQRRHLSESLAEAAPAGQGAKTKGGRGSHGAEAKTKEVPSEVLAFLQRPLRRTLVQLAESGPGRPKAAKIANAKAAGGGEERMREARTARSPPTQAAASASPSSQLSSRKKKARVEPSQPQSPGRHSTLPEPFAL